MNTCVSFLEGEFIVPWRLAENCGLLPKNGVQENNKLNSLVISVLGRDIIIFTVEMGIPAVTRRGDPSARGQGVSWWLNEKIAWKRLAVARDMAFFAT